MKKLDKFAIKIMAFCSLIFLLSSSVNAQGLYAYMEGSYSYSSFTASSIPSSFRDVPAHKDDGGGSTGVINQASCGLNSIFSYEVGARRIYENKSSLSLGLIMGVAYNFAERNYTNHPGTDDRSIGAALTFSGIAIHGPSVILGLKPLYPGAFLSPKICYEFPLSRNHIYPRIGLDCGYQILTAVNGWDRYSSLEGNDFVTLGHIVPISISYRISMLEKESSDGRFGLSVGARLYIVSWTKDGREFGSQAFPLGAYISVIL
ncbi:MAG: hypothetical protein ACOYL8_04840 [Patescibacteria group bacterium]